MQMHNKIPTGPSPFLTTSLVLAFALAGAPGQQGGTGSRGDEAAKRQDREQEKESRPQFVRSSEVFGKSVDNGAEGEDRAELGTVEDLVVRADGSIRSVVLRTGATLGLGGRQVAFPLKSMTRDPEKGTWSLTLTPDELRRMPAFDPVELAREDRERKRREAPVKSTAAEASLRRPEPPMLASEWMDMPVRTASDDLGTPKELVVEWRSGRLAFATVSIGGVLGLGAEQILVPWAALRPVLPLKSGDDSEPHLMLGVGRETLEDAPRLKDLEKQLGSASYRSEVYEHFQVGRPDFEPPVDEKGRKGDDAGATKKNEKKKRDRNDGADGTSRDRG